MRTRRSTRIPALFLVPLLAGPLVGCERPVVDPGGRTESKGSPSDRNDEPFDFESVAKDDTDATSTKHDGAERGTTNRLAQSNSPYLLLHAHNPVDWYPWGPEAFEKAKRENKPIFLSIGYSSCHWCHVMERLVFSNVEIARQMNERFVCIKVDREERPDVDRVYMTGLLTYFQAVGSEQGGGWPLSIFLTPDGKPFLGGTYFPPEGKEGRPGFPEVAKRAADLWRDKTDSVEEFAGLLVTQMRRTLAPTLALKRVTPSVELVERAADELLDSFDAEHGGFGFDARRPDEPKFPVGSRLAFLQYRVRRFGDDKAEAALRTTLDAMAAGGLYDHLAGGFHRYSTDRRWRVPHFEKMLYDQAQLAAAYAEAYRIGQNPADRRTAEGVLDFVLASMRNDEGGFVSAIDAESDGGIEGAYYVWTRDEVERVLGEADGTLFAASFGLDGPPDLDEGHVLHRTANLSELSRRFDARAADIETRLDGARRRLLEARRRRRSPRIDDKVLASWNGLMIRSLADAGRVLGREEYTRAAADAALFVLTELRDREGRLLRSHREGRAGQAACLDDYAFLVEGLLALYETTRDERWFNAARRLTDDQLDLFWDERGHGFYFTARDGEELVVPVKLAYDDALPAGNAVSVRNLVRIASISGVDAYRDRARETLQAFVADLERAPLGTSTLALATGEFLDDPDFGSLPSSPSGGAGPVSPARYVPSGRRGSVQLVSAEEEAEPEDEDPKEEPATRKKDDIVEARAFLEYDKLPAGGRCRILFQLNVAKGWHVNANPPKPDYMKPVEVEVTSKRGIKLATVAYPKGKEYRDDGLDEVISIYEGRVDVRGTLEIPAEAAGALEELQLVVKYQPCRDGRCLRPQTLELKGRVSVVPASDVQPINGKHFPRKKP